MLTSRLVAAALYLGLMPSVAMATCIPRDFLAMTLPTASDQSAIAKALELAYPGASVDINAGLFKLNGVNLLLGEARDRTAEDRLTDATIRDQFTMIYPLSFDLTSRQTPWFDPGRPRNDQFFRLLYGNSQTDVVRTLQRATYFGGAEKVQFAATSRFCVATQLQAALDVIATEGTEMDEFFKSLGGSFNWRVISGTSRLSAHSFGIAVDFNTRLGGYWRWSGEAEGSVGRYENQYPEALVAHMERFGFIWGGKWHHYDGMHFEYRPELILYARLLAEVGS